MTQLLSGKGSCLCEAVRISANNMSNKVGACHCNMCRKWTGGPLMAIDCGSDVSFQGEENIGIYNSSQWADRGFCKQCGNHLFYRFKATNQYFIPAGLFDGGENLIFDHQVFIDEKPEYYCFANETQNMTGAELIAVYTSDTTK
jgi:hypothetical protein